MASLRAPDQSHARQRHSEKNGLRRSATHGAQGDAIHRKLAFRSLGRNQKDK